MAGRALCALVMVLIYPVASETEIPGGLQITDRGCGMTGGASLVVRQAVCLGDLHGCPVASGTIPLDLVMLRVAAAAGRNAVGKGHRHRRHVASGAGKLVPVMVEADGPHPRCPPRR